MDELVLGNLVGMLMRQLEESFENGALPEHAQVIVRLIFTRPDGEPRVWIMVNGPN